VSTFSVGVGFGVDVFGDSRYPAICCGVVAFKATSTRMSNVGIQQIGP
jgi:Asp-tRNA(Asn)/Glu-tRNA(Gln) amidotransferase A subunit family amidase